MNPIQPSNIPQISKIESVLMKGDLAPLSETERLTYYRQVCDSLGLNYLTRPFDYQSFNGKLMLYARKDCADQLRSIKNVSINITSREKIGDIYIVSAKARMPDGREDESTGAVNVANLRGEALANAFLKCETKAKRRVTLSICGLGLLDETEAESVEIQEKEYRQEQVKAIQQDRPGKPSEAQLKRLFAISHQCKATHEQVKQYLQEQFMIASSKDLNLRQYDTLCEDLQSGKFASYFVAAKEAREMSATVTAAVVAEQAEEPKGDTRLPWEKYLDGDGFVTPIDL